MPKPKWIKENKSASERSKWIWEQAPKCLECGHNGTPVKEVKHKGKERVMLYECSLHPKCYYTKYSIGCDDYM